MAMLPKRTKYRKVQRGQWKGTSSRANKLDFGDYGLQVLESGWITDRQIEACRVTMTRHTKRKAKLWIRIFPDKPVSKKPLETRMGKGKPGPDHWVSVVKSGRVLFEISGCSYNQARGAMFLAANKLGLRTRLLIREGLE